MVPAGSELLGERYARITEPRQGCARKGNTINLRLIISQRGEPDRVFLIDSIVQPTDMLVDLVEGDRAKRSLVGPRYRSGNELLNQRSRERVEIRRWNNSSRKACLPGRTFRAIAARTLNTAWERDRVRRQKGWIEIASKLRGRKDGVGDCVAVRLPRTNYLYTIEKEYLVLYDRTADCSAE